MQTTASSTMYKVTLFSELAIKLNYNSHFQKKQTKLKVKAEHLYSALHGIQTTLKCSGMDHTVLPAINTMPAFTS